MDYRNVKSSPADLAEMLGRTGGRRQVPVILEGERVTVGFGGT